MAGNGVTTDIEGQDNDHIITDSWVQELKLVPRLKIFMAYFGKTKHIFANISQVKVVLIKNWCDLFWGASSDTMESQYLFLLID